MNVDYIAENLLISILAVNGWTAERIFPLRERLKAAGFFDFATFQFQLAVRSQTNSSVASKDLAAAIGRVNPTLALTFRPLSDFVITARNQERLVALLAGAF